MAPSSSDGGAAAPAAMDTTDAILSAASGTKREAQMLEDFEAAKLKATATDLEPLLLVEKRARNAGEIAVVVKVAEGITASAARPATGIA